MQIEFNISKYRQTNKMDHHYHHIDAENVKKLPDTIARAIPIIETPPTLPLDLVAPIIRYLIWQNEYRRAIYVCAAWTKIAFDEWIKIQMETFTCNHSSLSDGLFNHSIGPIYTKHLVFRNDIYKHYMSKDNKIVDVYCLKITIALLIAPDGWLLIYDNKNIVKIKHENGNLTTLKKKQRAKHGMAHIAAFLQHIAPDHELTKLITKMAPQNYLL